ncbi:M1 family metallopeptidase [Streptomyces sp. TS71-3]|uniref:M1 family metallopeptidase n=1 Tax=Streptomyces sp. TS71-3 TaxID=2733862 RepID=UPI001B045913|nr:M1 family metallopeptidase [Streptomyces sp. TS71-3]GHJ39763.1 metallopeptidase [Streptomyces sp. TS71-3]
MFAAPAGASPTRPRRRPARGRFLATALAVLSVTASLTLTAESTAVAATADGHGAPGARGLGDPYFPLAGNGGYTTRHYDLDLAYDPLTRRLDATEAVTARATQRLSTFDLDLSGLTVRGVRVNGRTARWTRDGQELAITPAKPLGKGQGFRVDLSYGGVPEDVTDPDGSADGWISTDDGAFVAGEPQGAMSWFAADNHPLDKASYTFEITVPAGYTAVANGVLASQRTRAGKTTFHWRQSQPMASYLATATVGKFDVQRYTTASGIPVYNAVDPREAADAAPALARIPAILDWESDLFGPYPFSAAGAIVDHAPDVGYALETQTRPIYDRAPGVGTVVHEMAHQWFGDSVSLTSWQDIWLNEGFATYAEWLWEEQHGGKTAQASFDGYYARPATNSLWAFPPADPGEGANIFASPVYTRGAMTLQELRTAVGDTDFFTILKTWARSHRYGSGTTAQFIALSERVSRKDLGALFHTWLYTAGKPARP